MSNVSGMYDERGLLRHAVYEIYGLRKRPVDIGVRLFIEADVSVTDLHEEGLSRLRASWPILARQRQIDRREYTACQDEQRAGPAVGHALEGVASRLQWLVLRHGRLLPWWIRQIRLRSGLLYSQVRNFFQASGGLTIGQRLKSK